MATPKQSSTQPPVSAAAAVKKGRATKERHVADGAKAQTRKHVEEEQEAESATTAAVLSQNIIEEIIDDAALQLYKRLLDRKCFSFAAYSTWRLVLSNVDMCYIRCDPGDPSEEVPQKPLGEHQKQPPQRRYIGQHEHVKEEQEKCRQQEPQQPQYAQQGLCRQSPQPTHQQNQQINPQPGQSQGGEQQQHQQPNVGLWICEEMPQLAPLDNWAPGSLTIKSPSPFTIPVSAGKKGKKAGSSVLT